METIKARLDDGCTRIGNLALGTNAPHCTLQQSLGIGLSTEDGTHVLGAEIGLNVVRLPQRRRGYEQPEQRQIRLFVVGSYDFQIIEMLLNILHHLDNQTNLPETHCEARRIGSEPQDKKTRKNDKNRHRALLRRLEQRMH